MLLRVSRAIKFALTELKGTIWLSKPCSVHLDLVSFIFLYFQGITQDEQQNVRLPVEVAALGPHLVELVQSCFCKMAGKERVSPGRQPGSPCIGAAIVASVILLSMHQVFQNKSASN